MSSVDPDDIDDFDDDIDDDDDDIATSVVTAVPTTATTPSPVTSATALTAAGTPTSPTPTPTAETTAPARPSATTSDDSTAELTTASSQTVFVTTENQSTFTVTAAAEGASPTRTTNGQGGSQGLSAGAAAGVAFGVIIPILLLGVGLWYFLRRRRTRRRKTSTGGARTAQSVNEKRDVNGDSRPPDEFYGGMAKVGHNDQPVEAAGDREFKVHDGRYGGVAELHPSDRAAEVGTGNVPRKALPVPAMAELDAGTVGSSELPANPLQASERTHTQDPLQQDMRSPQSTVSPLGSSPGTISRSDAGIVSP
ncbi:hypothetical protein LTR37_018616 [Vermiconidia calcicola]|uniref:Uncharacterized protein n=1 Tax=Vermiconidia calcicola TaxID=1690605 RepID=A0ACC3MGN5_9PEZI|nr:hypothetical protein LTR37_018616 [Vermiconidia calcicola]